MLRLLFSQLHVAFYREQLQKVYVTHLLKEQSENVWQILSQENGHIYVCGSVACSFTFGRESLIVWLFLHCIYRDARNMARDVHDIIVDVCRQHGNMSASEALQYVKKLETQRRYSADVWS